VSPGEAEKEVERKGSLLQRVAALEEELLALKVCTVLYFFRSYFMAICFLHANSSWAESVRAAREPLQ